MDRKHCGKRKNCSVRAISPFLKDLYCGHIKPVVRVPHLVGGACVAQSVEYLRTEGHWFDAQLSQYSFRGLMIVIATGFNPLSQLSVVSTIDMLESSQWLGKDIARSIGEEDSRKAWIGALAAK